MLATKRKPEGLSKVFILFFARARSGGNFLFIMGGRGVHSWCRLGVWEHILSELSKDDDGEHIIDLLPHLKNRGNTPATPKSFKCRSVSEARGPLINDATIVRPHPCAAGYKKNPQDKQALGRSKGGFTTKIHAVVDALGQALRLNGGATSRYHPSPRILSGFRGCYILAGDTTQKSSYGRFKIRGVEQSFPRAHIEKRSGSITHIYKERHLVAFFFNKLKHFRRIFWRFEKKASSFMGFLAYASSILWMR
jgi:transposase